MKKISLFIKKEFAAIKTVVSKLHISNGTNLIHKVVTVALATSDGLQKALEVINLLPFDAAIKAELTKLINEAIPAIKALSNETLIDGLISGLQLEAINIVSGKVHDIATIENDIKVLLAADGVVIK